MNILITGSTGFIAGNLISSLRKDNKVYCQSRSLQKKDDGIINFKHDLINDSWDALNLPNFEVVYFLSAQTSNYIAKDNPYLDLQSNLLSLINLIEYFRKRKEKPFIIYTGTLTQFGYTKNIILDENHKSNPQTFYDLSKQTAENYLLRYIKENIVFGTALRLCNIYGRNPFNKSLDRDILSKVYNFASAGMNVKLFGDGQFKRDYLHIDDLITALKLAYKFKKTTNGNYYLLGTGESVSLTDAFNEIIDLANTNHNTKTTIEYVDPPSNLYEIEYRDVLVNPSKFYNDTGWKPKFLFKEGVKEVFNQI